MTYSEKKDLQEKVESGFATQKELDEYSSLLKNDYDFIEDIEVGRFVEKAKHFQNQKKTYELIDNYYASTQKWNIMQILKENITYSVGIAALLLISFGIYFYVINQKSKSQQIALENNNFYLYEASKGNNNYSAGSFSIGNIPVVWYENKSQKENISYQLCNDTLKLYVKEKSLKKDFEKNTLLYETSSKDLLIEFETQKAFRLKKCMPILPFK